MPSHGPAAGLNVISIATTFVLVNHKTPTSPDVSYSNCLLRKSVFAIIAMGNMRALEWHFIGREYEADGGFCVQTSGHWAIRVRALLYEGQKNRVN
jgi:hypothetical protein